MIKEEPRQRRFLLSPSIYDKVIPEDHLVRKLEEYVDWKRIDDICLPLYCEDKGRPVTNYPQKMFKAHLLLFWYDWSDRELVENTRYHLAIKWFLKLDVDEEPFNFSALSKFRSKLGLKKHTEIFQDILRQVNEAGLLDYENQFMDSTAVRGDVALLGTTQLIQKMCEYVVTRARERGYTIPEPPKTPEGCKKTLEDTVKDAHTILEAARGIADLECEKLMLESILNDYVDTEKEIKERKKKGPGRIVSPVDSDVKWGAKSDDETWPGYKAHTSMTQNRFITSVVVTPANVPDEKVACELYDQQEKKPSTVTGDGAYGTGENRREFKERGCILIAPLRGQENPTKLFPKSAFSWDGGRVTCPQGKTTEKYTDNPRSRSHVFRFSARDCQDCPSKPACTTGAYRSLAISYYQAEFDEAERFNSTPEYGEYMRKRPLIESKYAETKSRHGMARARYRGLERVAIQVILTFIVANLKNLIRLLTQAARAASQRKPSIPVG